MTPEFVIGFAQEAVKMVILIAAPMLGLGLIVGVMVSVFQAATQIQEMTLTFVPKILAVFLGLMLFAPWMLEKLVSFTRYCITQIPLFIH
ncbi:MAG: Flagellar biosynthetic protein fliQ [Candidatus Magnetoglobus multicellularis str. Araruama]|uniref:Flagellar biosynthetic protein FliQ n=1 Tax=Candidatus Magnetoglobus multicellularis str. Araruama TaxID=890399 RepID=A0A1V1PE08_9BACT|nr:MAG: Flagellar biosynthetic protein fliQ [Candidatus Magnetoglobus multicellularis str. Araruama]